MAEIVRRPGLRVFLALSLGVLFEKELAQLLRLLKDGCRGVAWAKAPQIHITLHFFGALAATEISRIEKPLAAVCARSRPFAVRLAGLGFFPDPLRPRVLWTSPCDGQSETAGLQSRIAAVLSDLGFPAETRPFVPHATLGRIRGRFEAQASWFKAAGEGFSTALKEARCLDLYQSCPGPEGSVYEVLQRYPLGENKP